MTTKTNQYAYNPRPAGFTLTELMVAIAIIALLVGLLLPAVNTVRNQARNAKTRSAITAIETGLEQYKAADISGGRYAPSNSDRTGAYPQGSLTANPYADLGINGDSGSDIRISGAGLLVWALAGADRLGTPGFQVFRSSNNTGRWSFDTDAINNGDDPTQSGAYALRSDDRRPLQPRFGPYVDPSKIDITAFDRGAGHFLIEAEGTRTAGGPTGANQVRRKYPMFLDGNGFPILYFRADTAGRAMADDDRTVSGADRGIYHWEDNRDLIANNSNQKLVLRQGAENHSLDWDNNWDAAGNPTAPADQPDVGTFNRFIWNDANTARFQPHRSESYLLISPGIDGLYGTGDDIANFDHNGQ